jgi:hypothetical protein
MLRTLLLCAAAFAACTPSPQDAAMRQSSLTTGTIMQGASNTESAASGQTGQDGDDRFHAARGPIPTPVSAAEDPASVPKPAMSVDSPAEALGRRILSTAFVRVGPDDNLTVELHNGHVLVLQNMVMRRKDYCGVQVLEGLGGTKYCGRYADVVAARPGGHATPVAPEPVVSNPVKPEPRFPEHK